MAIRKLPSGKYQVDWYVGTDRKRQNFDTKNAAEAFDRDRRLREVYGADPTELAERKTIAEAAKWYHATVTVTKKAEDVIESERHMFAVLYECLRTNDVIARDSKKPKLEFIDEVEFSHLRSIQTYLTTKPTHGICKSHEKQRARSITDPIAREARLQEVASTFSTIAAPEKCLMKDKRGKPLTCSAQVLSASRVNRFFNTWKDFFNLCDQNGWLKKNPALYLESLIVKSKTKVVHDDKTVQSLINAAAKLAVTPLKNSSEVDGRMKYWNDVGDTLWFLAKTGARPVEVKKLVWSDIDFENKEMTLRSIKGTGEEKIRSIPLTEELCQFLADRKDAARRRFDAKKDSPVFRAARGAEFDSKAFGRSVKILCEKIGVEDFTPYCLRHGFVTRARRSGVSIDDAGDLAGHSKKETTKKVYDHTSAEDRRPAMQKIGAALKIVRKGAIA